MKPTEIDGLRPLADLSGVYRTNYGLMLFEQEGAQVAGCYEWGNGALTGNMEGSVVQFEWREDNGEQIGTALMVLAQSGDQLNGLWYEDGVYRGLWIGSRAGVGERPNCSPQADGALEQSLRESGRASFMESGSTWIRINYEPSRKSSCGKSCRSCNVNRTLG